MCEVVYGASSLPRRYDALPPHPNDGPVLWLNQSLNSQWMFWVGLGNVDDTDPVAMRTAEAVIYLARRIRMKYNEVTGRIDETLEGKIMTTDSALPTKRLFRQRRPVRGERVCYRFDVASVNRFGSQGFLRNEIVFHPAQFGLEVNSAQQTDPCWQRLCSAGGESTGLLTAAAAAADLRLRVDTQEWSWQHLHWTYNITWNLLAKSRCQRVLLTTPRIDHERCGNDQELLLVEDNAWLLVKNLVEQCNFTITVIDLPSGRNSTVEFRTPSRDVIQQARDINIGDLLLDTRVSPQRSDHLFLATNVSWRQPYDMKLLRGFCLQLFERSSTDDIPHPRPTYSQCRDSRIQPIYQYDAMYTKKLVRLKPGTIYELEIATMVSNSFFTFSSSLVFTTPKLQPSNLQLLSLNRSNAVVAWKFNPVRSVKQQGGRLYFAWLEVPHDSLLATEIDQQLDNQEEETDSKAIQSRIIGQAQQRSTDDSGALQPASFLAFLSDWNLLREYVQKKTSFSGIRSIELHDSDTYSTDINGLTAGRLYAVVIFGPNVHGRPGIPSLQLAFKTEKPDGDNSSDDTGPDPRGASGSSNGGGSFWTKGHVASVVVPSAGIVLILVVVVMILVIVYLCRQRSRGYPTSAQHGNAALVRKRSVGDVIMTSSSMHPSGGRDSSACFRRQKADSGSLGGGSGSVISRPATWIAHDANAVPMLHFSAHADNHEPSARSLACGAGGGGGGGVGTTIVTTMAAGSSSGVGADVTYSSLSAMSSPVHYGGTRRVSSFSGVGSPGHSRNQTLSVPPGDGREGPSIELRRAPSGRSCVHAVEFSAIRPGSPNHPLAGSIASPEHKNIFLSTIYGESVFNHDSLRRSKSSMAAIGGGSPAPTSSAVSASSSSSSQPPRTAPKPFKFGGEGGSARDHHRPYCVTTTSTACSAPRVSTCTISVSNANESALASFRAPDSTATAAAS
ncbi:uncharacterized protein LOC135811757 isoform X2 [Sycon ciliatum]